MTCLLMESVILMLMALGVMQTDLFFDEETHRALVALFSFVFCCDLGYFLPLEDQER